MRQFSQVQKLTKRQRRRLGELYSIACTNVNQLGIATNRGIPIDVQELDSVEVECDSFLDEAEKVLLSHPEAIRFRTDREDEWKSKFPKKDPEKMPFMGMNPSSPPQLKRFFMEYTDIDLSGLPKTGTGSPSLGKESLTKIDHPIAKVLADRAVWAKLKSAYIKSYRAKLTNDGKLHPTFGIAGTVTGRWSSSDPNFQAVAKRGKGKIIRKIMKAPEGYSWVAADYGALEARLGACVTEDPTMLHRIIHGLDIHLDFTQASAILEPSQLPSGADGWIDPKEMKGLRQTTKMNTTFCYLYAGSVQTSADAAKSRVSTAQALQDLYFRIYPGIKTWHEDSRSELARTGVYVLPSGRLRAKPLTLNAKLNNDIQSLGADCVNEASAILYRMGIHYNLQIHDDLSMLVKNEDIPEVLSKLIPVLLSPSMEVAQRAPLAVEVEIGESLYSMESLGDFDARELGLWNGTDPLADQEDHEIFDDDAEHVTWEDTVRMMRVLGDNPPDQIQDKINTYDGVDLYLGTYRGRKGRFVGLRSFCDRLHLPYNSSDGRFVSVTEMWNVVGSAETEVNAAMVRSDYHLNTFIKLCGRSPEGSGGPYINPRQDLYDDVIDRIRGLVKK